MKWRDLLFWRKPRRKKPSIDFRMGATMRRFSGPERIEATGFLTRALQKSMDDATRLIQQRVEQVGAVDTRRLRASISFVSPYLGSSGTVHPQVSLIYTAPTGTLSPWAPERWGPEYRRDYITTWQCSWCNRLNGATWGHCQDCGAKHENIDMLPLQSIPRQWTCPWCQGIDQADPFKCGYCGSNRSF